jgi:hypothetical protein
MYWSYCQPGPVGKTILADDAFLERDDIQACLDNAAARTKHTVLKVS